MDKPLLSICIPTYNRSNLLVNSIESIIKQERFISGEVEIIVSDNNSTDDTKNICEKYQEMYNNFYYFKNEINVRDKNFPIIMGEAHGLLRRLSNDTIIYSDDALEYMCEMIEKHKADRPFLFWANGHSKNNLENAKLDFKTFIEDSSYWITFNPCFSIWDNDCLEIGSDFEAAELCLWQVRKTLQLVARDNEAIICNKDITKIQKVKNKDVSYGIFNVFHNNYLKLLEPYFCSGMLDNDCKEYLEKDLLYNFFTNPCIRWESQIGYGVYSKTENLKDLIFAQYNTKPYWQKYLRFYKRRKIVLKTKAKIKKILGIE